MLTLSRASSFWISARFSLSRNEDTSTGTCACTAPVFSLDRKSTRLNSSHSQISYAVFCLKKKKKKASGTTNRRENGRLTIQRRTWDRSIEQARPNLRRAHAGGDSVRLDEFDSTCH